jgi:hypothetical protein
MAHVQETIQLEDGLLEAEKLPVGIGASEQVRRQIVGLASKRRGSI